jgi:hypothetical protein
MKTIQRLRQRLRHVIRVELGHALLGHIEEHRLPYRSTTKYEGPIEALKVLRNEKAELIRNKGTDVSTKEPLEYESKKYVPFLTKSQRKDAQLFFP